MKYNNIGTTRTINTLADGYVDGYEKSPIDWVDGYGGFYIYKTTGFIPVELNPQSDHTNDNASITSIDITLTVRWTSIITYPEIPEGTSPGNIHITPPNLSITTNPSNLLRGDDTYPDVFYRVEKPNEEIPDTDTYTFSILVNQDENNLPPTGLCMKDLTHLQIQLEPNIQYISQGGGA